MDFPHHHHHHHHQNDEEEQYPPPARPPPPSSFFNEPPPPPPPHQVAHVSHTYHNLGAGGFENYPPPPPPQVTHVHHTSHHGGGGEFYPPHERPSDYYSPPPPPPPPPYSENYSHSYDQPPPQRPSVQHVSHESHDSEEHPHRLHMPSFFHHHSHSSTHSEINQKPAVRVYTKAEPDYSLTIRDGKVILARSNPSDPYQYWIKDERYSTKVKDEEGFPSFALVNKATGAAIKHSIGATHPVRLIPYNPDYLDESVLWTLSNDLGDGFRTIRMVNNIRLNVDAFNGDKNHGGVHDGTIIVLWEWKKGENQRWKIVPY